jgi:hypothetical protein
LPDFSWYNIPKSEKINQITQKRNGHIIFQIAVKRPNGHKIYQPLPAQVPPKFTQIT